MKIRGNEIIVHRNETFTLDFLVAMRDGTPFIIDENIENPYVLLSVSGYSYTYDKTGKYMTNWWLPLTNVPKFHSTIPVEIDAFTQENLAVDGENYLYVGIENGKKAYKYWNGEEFVDYSFRITKTFSHDETKEWIQQSYIYSISFVAGQDSLTYLQSVWKSEWGEMPDDLDAAWEKATVEDPSILDILEYASPICNYSDVLTFIEPSKLTVLSDIKGSL